MPSWRGAQLKHRDNFTFLPFTLLFYQKFVCILSGHQKNEIQSSDILNSHAIIESPVSIFQLRILSDFTQNDVFILPEKVRKKL
jgi:hypothetical protein